MKLRYLIPAGVLLSLVILFAAGLRLEPGKVPSPLIGQSVPPFTLPMLTEASAQFSSSDLVGGDAVLVNFWASWCTPCLEEHPLLMELSRQGIPIIGINYKDEPAAALQWLRRHSNPFQRVAVDYEGRAALDWGVYGVPETYLVDGQGIIRYKQIGPLTRAVWEREMASWFRRTS
jgi:cytochrome c biogenesis protein CcmG, thiol:disulfide interchange protein DsbE